MCQIFYIEIKVRTCLKERQKGVENIQRKDKKLKRSECFYPTIDIKIIDIKTIYRLVLSSVKCCGRRTIGRINKEE